MKLNYKRTILVGFAFFLICAFWQAYDNTIPLILTNKFGMSQTWSGVRIRSWPCSCCLCSAPFPTAATAKRAAAPPSSWWAPSLPPWLWWH